MRTVSSLSSCFSTFRLLKFNSVSVHFLLHYDAFFSICTIQWQIFGILCGFLWFQRMGFQTGSTNHSHFFPLCPLSHLCNNWAIGHYLSTRATEIIIVIYFIWRIILIYTVELFCWGQFPYFQFLCLFCAGVWFRGSIDKGIIMIWRTNNTGESCSRVGIGVCYFTCVLANYGRW